MNTILHMIETGGTGGAETVYVNLVRGLDPTRWRHVAVLPTREWMYDQLTDSGVQPVLVPERWAFDVVYFARMTVLIKRLRVDLIHAHLFGSAVRAALLSRACGVPAIATLHGGMDLRPRERFHNLKVAIVNRGLKHIVFVSEPLRRSFLESVPLRPDLATVIPNGIDASRFSSGGGQAFRAEFGIMPDEFVVGTVGTPGRAAKGLDVLLDVAALLKRRSPGIRFVIVGDLDRGRGTELLNQRASSGLTDDVVVTGFRSDVERALDAFDVYALTSRSEGFSLALVEAMASGLPVVATRCGGPEQILSDGATGLLVENGSAEAIASAIERLRTNSDERRRLGAAARDAVRGRFTLERQVRSYERLYQQLLGSDIRVSPESGTENPNGAATGISVVIPTYNRADYIRATVESVLAQTLAPAEVIIVDDGSTDNTRDVCLRFRSPVRYIRRQNEGPSAARNAGIRAATGDWIAFCDSDDLWEPHKLELQMKAIIATKAGWCIADFRVIDPEGQPVRSGTSGLAQAFPVLKDSGIPPAKHFSKWLEVRQLTWGSSSATVYHGDLFGMLFLGNVVLPSTAIVSRELIERAGPFDATFRRAEDTEFFHRISAHAPAVIVMDPLVRYRVGHASIMTGDAAPFIEYTLRSVNEASSRRSALTAAERAAFHEGRRQLRLRLAYTRLASFDGAGARQALYQGWHEDRTVSPRSTAIMVASFLPDSALRGLHWAKQAIRRRLQ